MRHANLVLLSLESANTPVDETSLMVKKIDTVPLKHTQFTKKKIELS